MRPDLLYRIKNNGGKRIMFENGKKAARKLRRLMAVAAVPALMALALYLPPTPPMRTPAHCISCPTTVMWM